MAIELTTNIKNLIDAHKNNAESCNEDMSATLDRWKSPETINKYTWEYFCSALQAELNTIMTDSQKTDVVLNQKLNTVIAEAKAELLPFLKSGATKTADNAIQVSNALNFLSYEGNELTDEKAFKILKPFIDDFEQMDLFADVVERQVGSSKFINSSGECTFDKTFGKTNRIRTLLNLFNEAEAISENLFIYPKVDGVSVIINAHISFSCPSCRRSSLILMFLLSLKECCVSFSMHYIFYLFVQAEQIYC